MVNKCRMGSAAAAFAFFLLFPALASAHLLSVSVGPSECVSPLNGEYTATVTITETWFGGTTENIPVGKDVRQLASSTDRGNSGLNQNYFTQGAVGTQTGPANLGQPTSFGGTTTTAQFTVTTSVPETYVLGNSYMSSPSSATISAPRTGCTPPPPPPPTCPAGQTLTGGQCVPPTACPSGQTLSGGRCLPPTVCPSGEILSGGQCTPPSTCPNGEILSGGQCVPPTTCPSGETLSGGRCVPPTVCPSGETLSGGQCVPPTVCPAGETMLGSVCAAQTVALPPAKIYPGVCRASSGGYKVRAGQQNTIVVSVRRHGAAVAGAKVRITLPGGKSVTRTTGKSGKVTLKITPTRAGTIYVRSASCKAPAKVAVLAAKTTTVARAPSFTG